MSELKTPFKVKWIDHADVYEITENPEDSGSYLVSCDGTCSSYGKYTIHRQIEEGLMVVVRDNSVCTPEATPDVITEASTGAIKSDGGSSSYYDIPIPDWLIDLIVERKYIKTEELIEVLGSNFDEANILKCLVRINSLRNGKGKEGNSVDYDCNKIIYSANRIKEVTGR